MIRIVPSLFAAALFACIGLVAACSHRSSSGLTAKQEEAVKKGVMERVNDPEFAKFGAMLAVKAEKIEVIEEDAFEVCGYVNVRNGRDAPYYGVLFSGPNGDWFVVGALGGDETDRAVTLEICQNSGMPLH